MKRNLDLGQTKIKHKSTSIASNTVDSNQVMTRLALQKKNYHTM